MFTCNFKVDFKRKTKAHPTLVENRLQLLILINQIPLSGESRNSTTPLI